MRFCILRRNSRWPPKTIFGKKRQLSLWIPWGFKNFNENADINAFYTEIQDGCQKWQEIDFWEKSPVDSADTLWVKNFEEIADINAFYTEIQDGCQKWQEIDFWEKSPVDSADTLWVKNFEEIALSRTISEINAFLCFMQKFKMATKNGRKLMFGKSHQFTLLTV